MHTHTHCSNNDDDDVFFLVGSFGLTLSIILHLHNWFAFHTPSICRKMEKLLKRTKKPVHTQNKCNNIIQKWTATAAAKNHHITKRNNATKLFTIFIFIIYYKHFCTTQLCARSNTCTHTHTRSLIGAEALTLFTTTMEMENLLKFLRQMNGKSACWSEKYHKCMHILSYRRLCFFYFFFF